MKIKERKRQSKEQKRGRKIKERKRKINRGKKEINAVVSESYLLYQKLKVEARIRIQNILDSDFCSKNENLQNAFCVKYILYFLISQSNTSDF